MFQIKHIATKQKKKKKIALNGIMNVLANTALMPMCWITSIQALTLTIQAKRIYLH